MTIHNIIERQREKGEKNRKQILSALPSTIYRLHKQLKLSPSTIRYHLKILQSLEFVDSIEIRRNNRISLRYFLKNKESYDTLHFPIDLFAPKGAICIYALTGSTFGVSTEQIEEWDAQSIWNTCVGEYETQNGQVIVTVPEEMKKHYQIPFGILEPAFSNDKKTAFFHVNVVEKSEKKVRKSSIF